MIIRKAEYIKSAEKHEHFPELVLPQIAIVGRSNVGKSSILNAMTNRKQLAKVSGTPGKTKLINFFNINDLFYIVDLPGYGFASSSKNMKSQWGKMMEGYFTDNKNLVMVLQLLDIRRIPSQEDKDMIEFISFHNIPALYIITKTDKISKGARLGQIKQIAKEINVEDYKNLFILTSAETKEGLATVWNKMETYLLGGNKHED
ncbi:MAG: ribosome biogenesis GTP-binding protein YihA/YsxC [Clostridia bacterium]